MCFVHVKQTVKDILKGLQPERKTCEYEKQSGHSKQATDLHHHIEYHIAI